MHPLCRIPLVAGIVLAGTGPLSAKELTADTIRICEDIGEWPPYTFYHRVNGKPTSIVSGFSVDVIAAIFGKAGIDYTIKLLPWARCQKEVEHGRLYQMALNASYNEQRAKTYHLSRPHYRTTNYYFYSRKTHPDGLAIANVNDLKKYRVCGLFGYNYETYGLPAGSIDQGARDFAAVIAKLHANRCDLFLEKYEVMAGFTALGQPFLADPDLGHAAVPGMAQTAFYMMISRRDPRGEQLLKLINDGVAEMEASGQLERLRRKYIP